MVLSLYFSYIFILISVTVQSPEIRFQKSFQVPQCNCTNKDVEILNKKVVPIISYLKKSTFFRIVKVSLNEKCLFWETNTQCFNPSCSVCFCEESEIPEAFKSESFGKVDRRLDKNFSKWTENDDMWVVMPRNSNMSYINLQLNPHGDTGFVGESPRKIWDAIYGENCFDADDPILNKKCLEEVVFYRLLSGMRSSVSAHISAMKFDGKVFAPNYESYLRSLGKHPERIKNLYFVYVFMVRALDKAREAIKQFPYSTGNDFEDALVRQKIEELLSIEGIEGLKESFNETILFNGNFFDPKIEQFKSSFRKISLILNCVECEKCKLYGKLQILGLGTALRILFAKNEQLCRDSAFFQRDEINAIILTLAEFSNSIRIVNKFKEREKIYFAIGLAAWSALSIALWNILKLCKVLSICSKLMSFCPFRKPRRD